MLRKLGPKETGYVFVRGDGALLVDSHLDQQHDRVRKLLKLPSDFVLHSLRHTPWGIRRGCVYDHASDGAFYRDRLKAVRAPFAGIC